VETVCSASKAEVAARAVLLQRELNAAFAECGCSTGAWCSAGALVISIALHMSHLLAAPWYVIAGRTLAAMVGAGALGKVAALAFARARIRRLLCEMRRFS